MSAKQFWIFNPSILLSDFTLIFHANQSLEAKMNAATRLFLIVMLLMFMLAVPHLYLYFFIGLLTIIIVYAIMRKPMCETFSPCFTEIDINNLSASVQVPPPVQSNRFNEPPPIINPSHDINDWRQSSLVEHSAVNKSRNGFRLKSSGYVPYEDSVDYTNQRLVGESAPRPLPYRRQEIPSQHVPCNVASPEFCNVPATAVHVWPQTHSSGPGHAHAVSVFNETDDSEIPVYTHGNTTATAGDLIEHCGYNPEKGRLAGVPHNQPISINDYFPTTRNYHKSLNTQTIEPGVYTTTEVHEPQMSNMGISFTQQFQPVAVDVDDFGNIIYERKDPRTYTEPKFAYDYNEITPESVYDPRLYGYGDHRRTYVDKVTGQPRFMYDDVDAARETNYITRNKIDVYNFTNQTGIFDEEVDCNPLDRVQRQAQEAFIVHGNEHRNSLQQSLLRKANERTRQQRSAPLRRDSHTRLLK